MNTVSNNEVKKLQVEEIVLFAINNIPDIDTTTLKQFLELVNAGGTFGSISHEQILKKMRMVLKYIPNACVSSLLILTDLLEIELSAPSSLPAPRNNRMESGSSSMPFIINASNTRASTGKLYVR